MNIGKLLLSTFVILLGILMFIYAEIDDSPGGQLIGVLVVVLGVAVIIRNRRTK